MPKSSVTWPGAPRTAEEARADWAARVEAGVLKPDPVICSWCEGAGRVERRHRQTRLLALLPCLRCDGKGHT